MGRKDLMSLIDNLNAATAGEDEGPVAGAESVNTVDTPPKQPSLAPRLVEMPLGIIDRDLSQPRKKGFGGKGIDELAASMSELGLQNPITVIPKPDNRFLLLTGQRRLEAATALGWKSILAIIQGEGTPLLRLARRLAENDLRVGFSKEDRRAGYLELAQECGGNVSVAAALIGISRTTFYNVTKEAEPGKTGGKAGRVSVGQFLKEFEVILPRVAALKEEQKDVLRGKLREMLDEIDRPQFPI